MPVDPSKIVTKEQFDASVAEMLKESPDHVLLLESPPSDVKRTEELLDIKEGTLPNFALRFKKGQERCIKCGRHFSVLDLIKTALQSHSREFLNEVIFAEEYSLNGEGQTPVCFDCGEPGPGPGRYKTRTYSCFN
jgi:hypothetical protein